MNFRGRINNWIQKQKSKSTGNQISDLLFILLIVALLIPPVRKELATVVNKILMSKPGSTNNGINSPLDDDAYQWEIMNSGGEKFFLKEFKGDVIFLNFWATWCPPCRAELPNLDNLYKAYNDRIQFIFLTYEPTDKAINFLSSKGFNIPVYTSGYSAPEQLHSGSIPATFIIDKMGNIVLIERGARKWDSPGLKSMLDQLIATD